MILFSLAPHYSDISTIVKKKMLYSEAFVVSQIYHLLTSHSMARRFSVIQIQYYSLKRGEIPIIA